MPPTPDRVRELFDRVFDAAPSDRSALLEELCDDPVLRNRVAALLAAHDHAANFPPEPTTSIAPPGPPLCDAEPREFGPYHLLELIGEGGFGSVYIAEQTRPLHRRVAVKLIKPGMNSRDVIARFEQERQALAVMNHPNIARVFDAGTTPPPASRPYFVMEYIKGEPITAYCDKQRLTVCQRLRLFAPVCDAIQHAHSRGIIHRDLKPSNILVTIADTGSPRPVVIDFGVAKAIAHRLTGSTVYTEQGQLIGTPEYMSPEQAEMSESDIDTRTDVYALGVILYELLTGALPFDSKQLRAAGLPALQKTIRELTPPRPSTRLGSMGPKAAEAAAARQLRLDELTRELRSELEWIPLKALRKDRAERYRSAAELGDDVANYLTGNALLAGPETTAYQLRKLLRRHKGPAIAAAAVLVAVLFGLAGTLWQARRAAERAATAETARTRAEAVNQFLWKTLRSADPYSGGKQDARVADVMITAVADLDAGCFKDDPWTEAALRGLIGDILVNNGRAAEAEPLIAKSLETLQRLYPGDHIATAATLHNLAFALQSCGRIADSEPLFRQSLDMTRRLSPGDDPDVAAAMDSLAMLLKDRGKFKEAESLCAQALEMRRRLFPPPLDHPDIASSLSSMARLSYNLGRIAESESLHIQALDMRRRLHPGDHPDIAWSLEKLAITREALGRPADAEPLYVEALEMRRRMFKGDHPDVAESLHRLALNRIIQGRIDGAEPLLLESLEMNRRIFKGDHPSIAGVLHDLGSVRSPVEFVDLNEQSLAMLKRLFPGDHPDVADAINSLAYSLLPLGRTDEAERLFEQALEMYRRIFKGDHPEIATTLNNVGRALCVLGRASEAEPFHREAVDMMRRVHEGDHHTTSLFMVNLAVCLHMQGKDAEAKPLALQAADMMLRRFPADHPEARKVLDRKHEVCGDNP